MQKTFKFPHGGLEVEIGKYARQADGAAWIKSGGNIVLATVVASKEEKDFMGFFPLTVEYRERMSAVGKIPGGYFKREGKLSDEEVLTSRLIDRTIRPLFPSFYFKELQLLATVCSSDGKFPVNVLGILGASLALTISPIPFLGPVGAVKVVRVDGQWLFNADYETSLKSDTDITIAGNIDGVNMVEGHCNNLSESEFIDVMFQAHEIIKQQIEWQISIQKELGVVKAESSSRINWEELENEVKNFFPSNFGEQLFGSTKADREAVVSKLREDLLASFAARIEAKEVSESVVKYLFESLLKDIIPDIIIKKQKRLDDRSFEQVRPIEIEVGVLPCAHGSSTFRRGETQVLTSLTLGTAQDAQKVDTLMGGMEERSFMLHYNFLPFSTGEIRPLRGVGRREVGHGYLAERSFLNVLPSQDKFPYTIRSVADVLESNGSSSMATVCATSLALMDAGAPIKDMVGGVAMGLIADQTGKNFITLTDILGSEDAYGLMDFKVTGTRTGIMAIQMDSKIKGGLSKNVLYQALQQARAGRLHILEKMAAVLEKPRENISNLAPQVMIFKIESDKIGAVIGSAGKTIKEIIAKTTTEIDIDDDGTVKVYGKNITNAEAARKWIQILAGEINPGMTFDGIVRRITEFGIFVELVPGKDGLVHISAIARDKQQNLDRRFKNGDVLQVKVVAYDKETGRVRLVAPELEKPQGK